MRIEADLKLGFKDVMIRPKRSTLSSRSQVSLLRKFIFRNSESEWEGVPIIAANMDTVGTFEMARVLSQHHMMTAIHKHYSRDEWDTFMKSVDVSVAKHIAVSTGTGQADADTVDYLLGEYDQLNFICIDVANGYSEHFVHFVKRMREKHPGKTIIAGNVVTGEMVEELILGGPTL